MLIYEFPFVYESFFNIPPFLLWKKRGLKMLSREFRHLNLSDNSKVLDVGCGTGFLAPVMRRYFPDAEIFGIDTSPQMIKLAQNKYGNFAQFKLFDFLQYKEKCDLIVSMNAFYFFEMQEIIQKVRELLNPEGSCVIITYTKTIFSTLHQYFTALLLKTFVKTYSPVQFYNAFQPKADEPLAHKSIDFTVSAKLISEIEGTYLLTIKRKK